MALSRSRSFVTRDLPRWCLLLVLLVGVCLPSKRANALRLPAEDESTRVRAYAMWNRQYLCLAARIPDAMITATSTAPMSAPEQDDALELAFEIPGGPETGAYRLIISAAGGMTLYSRDSRGHWRADPSWIAGARTIKFAVSVDGTLNDPSDKDNAFVVECAIPWEFLGGAALIGEEIGFNVLCWMQGEHEGVASWSPPVREPSQAGDAARWGTMLIKLGSGLAKATGSWVPCPFVARMPFVDGKLAADEWLAATTLEFDKPEPVFEPVAPPAEKTGIPSALMAIYRYDWQGRPGAGGGAPLWSEDSTPATIHQPQTGAGPWVSYDRVDWHADQLEEAQRAGIDIILARYSGQEEARRTWARAGLIRLGQALKERRAQGLGYPLVGMALDTGALAGQDLKSDDGKRRLYGMVREFFLHMPREFWAELGGAPSEGVSGGVPVLLGEPEVLSGWDGSFTDFCGERFAHDFGGARLVWIGSGAWQRGGAELYSYISMPGDTGFTMSAPGGARGVAISPGQFPLPGETGNIRGRAEGQSYRSDWQRALAAKPEFVVIDSWNDYARGSEIAPSRQHGVVYVDTTRYFQARLGSEQPYHLRLKQCRVPDPIAPGVEAQAEVVVENVGVQSLQTGVRVFLDYEIRRISDGAVVRREKEAQSFSVAAGQTKRMLLRVSAKDDSGQPMPPGDYVYTLRVVRSKVAYLRSEWLTRTLAQLAVPIRVGNPPTYKATVMSSSLPAAVETGATREVAVRLRNDGTAAWPMGQVRLSYHWIKQRDDLDAAIASAREVLVREGARADLPRDVPPGDLVSVMIPVSAIDSHGEALPPATPADSWHYRLQWDLVEGDDAWFSSGGHAAGEEATQVVARDRTAVFESVMLPAELPAQGPASVDLLIANTGGRLWRSGEARIAYRWYQWDGRLVGADVTTTGLPSDVAPGERARVFVSVISPPMPGSYWLGWDLLLDADDMRAFEAGWGGDLAMSRIHVRSTGVRPVDLSSHTNVVAAVIDSYRARGDFDGRGRSLPAEWLAPDQSGPAEQLYPSGYYAPARPQASVPFAFPPMSSGVGGAVACAGQSIALGEPAAERVHIIAASTSGPVEAGFGMVTQSGEREVVNAFVPPWEERIEGVPLAAYTPYVRTLAGDDAGQQAYLYHLTLSPESGRAVALELPDAPWVKILAITVEAP